MTIPFFQPDSAVIQPYALMDLDDTLFQTRRKIDAWNLPTAAADDLVCASVNKQGEPLSLMTTRQQALVNWLLTSTELIVVTARDTQEIKRVKLPFSSWQVLTHGAVILQSNGAVLSAWQTKMMAVLHPLQDRLINLATLFEVYNEAIGSVLKMTVHCDTFFATSSLAASNPASTLPQQLKIYLAIKHRQKDPQALQDFAHWLMAEQPNLAADFYMHSNANNLAILPHAIHKRHAVKFLLDQYLDPSRPSFGFGDSLADLPFLQLLDWYGTPNHGQLHDKIVAG